MEETKQLTINHAKEMFIRSWKLDDKIINVMQLCSLDRLQCIKYVLFIFSMIIFIFEVQLFNLKNYSQCYCNKFIANVSALFWCHFYEQLKLTQIIFS